MTTTLRFDPHGVVDCLYTEAVDLRALGRLHVVRATRIAFAAEDQCWEVRCATTGNLLHTHPSREACLAWERANLQPGADEGLQPVTSP